VKKKIVYTDEPMGDVEVIVDFLPSPAELAFKEDGVKVSLTLSKSSLDESQQDQASMTTSFAVRKPPTPFT
jgi:hypothetical protein